MLSAPLATVEIDPGEPAAAVVIWLHGLGADGHDFEPIVPHLQLPAELPVRFVFPHAPELPVTAFGGQRVRAWFDFDPGGGVDLSGLQRSQHKVNDLIQNEIDSGMPPERIVLAGFSQGGAVALQTAMTYPRRLAGILALSTFLADSSTPGSEHARANAGIPVLMCHGQHDPVLPVALGRVARDTLQQAGYPVQWLDYPMAHEVCPDEILAIGAWLRQVLGQGSQ